MTGTQIQKAAILKTYRTAVRLKYSLLADEEIYQQLPYIEEDIDRAILAGVPYDFSLAKVFDES